MPDFYQGTEFWDFSLVDPDNRRPVDFAARAAALDALHEPDWRDLAQNWRDGRIKLAWTTASADAARRAAARVRRGRATSRCRCRARIADHVIAFARRHDRDAVDRRRRPKLAPLTEQGRRWPSAADFDGELMLDEFQLDGEPRTDTLPLQRLFASCRWRCSARLSRPAQRNRGCADASA